MTQPQDPGTSVPRRRPIKKKICMLGTFAVGKTSLVNRFVTGIYSDDYLTTIGARIEKKTTRIGNTDIDLLVWDLNGEDRFQSLHLDYVQGASGYLLVIDKSRRASLEAAHALHQKVQLELGPTPFVLVVNKSDLNESWENLQADLDQLEQQGWIIRHTSAKLGTGVDDVFQTLAQLIIPPEALS